MVNWIDKEPEYDDWPTGKKYFTDDTTIQFDKNSQCIVQPENPEETGEHQLLLRLKNKFVLII